MQIRRTSTIVIDPDPDPSAMLRAPLCASMVARLCLTEDLCRTNYLYP
jgi:hypothetical protein